MELWSKLKGVDIILVPAMWGKIRKIHFDSLCQSVAIINQCYVIATNSKNSDMSNSCSIITPFGDVIKDGRKNNIKYNWDYNEISKMRKYIDIT